MTCDELYQKISHHYYTKDWEEIVPPYLAPQYLLYISDKEFFDEIMLEPLEDKEAFYPPIHFNGCIFHEGVFFSEDKFLDISFANCTFKEEATFESAKIQASYFNKVTFEKDVSFKWATFSLDTMFSDINFASGSFKGCAFNRQTTFINCNIQTRLDLNELVVENSTLTLRNMPLSKIDIGTPEINKLALSETPWPKPKEIFQDGVISEQIARDWKAKSLALSDMKGVSLWHFCEKNFALARTKKEKDWFLFALLHLYRFISFYGESPARAFTVLVLVAVAFPILFGTTIALPAEATRADLCLGFIPYWGNIANNSNLPLPIKLFQQIWKGIVWAQLAFFGMALRNCLRR